MCHWRVNGIQIYRRVKCYDQRDLIFSIKEQILQHQEREVISVNRYNITKYMDIKS